MPVANAGTIGQDVVRGPTTETICDQEAFQRVYDLDDIDAQLNVWPRWSVSVFLVSFIIRRGSDRCVREP